MLAEVASSALVIDSFGNSVFMMDTFYKNSSLNSLIAMLASHVMEPTNFVAIVLQQKEKDEKFKRLRENGRLEKHEWLNPRLTVNGK